MNKKAGILYNGRLLEQTFEEGVIVAGQWAYSQGYRDFQTVLLLENGEINHRAIIQIYDYKKGDYCLENHYTTCGTFHFPMEKFDEDAAYFTKKYKGDSRYSVSYWKEY